MGAVTVSCCSEAHEQKPERTQLIDLTVRPGNGIRNRLRRHNDGRS